MLQLCLCSREYVDIIYMYIMFITALISYCSASYTQLSTSSATDKKSKTQVRSCKQDFLLYLHCYIHFLLHY